MDIGYKICYNSAMTIEQKILEHINDLNTYFVFPTDIACSRWAEKIVQSSSIKSVGMNRFVPWDKFKAEAVRSEKQNKNSIPGVVRDFFACSIIEKNKKMAKEGKPLFTKIINPIYIEESGSFSKWISSVLPSLALWQEKKQKTMTVQDAEDKDFFTLYQEYKDFLDSNNLFDPAWEKPPFYTDNKNYIIFFPDILQDFTEYKEILESSSHISLVTVASLLTTEQSTLFISEYADSRSEIRHGILKIRDILSQGFSPSDIALSLPNIEKYLPYVKREFELYGIPFQIRTGRKLSQYPAGTLFKLILECHEENYSFASIKNLCLNDHFPWSASCKDAIQQLIQFGIQNNCLCAIKVNGKELSPWEFAFLEKKHPCASFFKDLKHHITKLVNASSFNDIRVAYFAFKEAFFDENAFSLIDDAILGRCLRELASLIHISQDFPQVIPDSVFSFFVTYLDSKDYIPQSEIGGVSVFPYKVAAGSPFAFHFVFNANQNDISVVYKPLSFLRQDKRDELALFDNTVSDNFVQLYSMTATQKVFFSCGNKTFTGFALPYNNMEKITDEKILEDPFLQEKDFFFNEKDLSQTFRIQKEGFESWRMVQGVDAVLDNSNFLLPKNLHEILRKKLLDSQTGLLKISPTHLNSFIECPRKYVYEKFLYLKNIDLKVSLLDKTFIGTFWHEIIHRFFKAIIEQDNGYLFAEKKDLYIEEIKQIAHVVIDNYPESCGEREATPLTKEILIAQKEGLIDTILAASIHLVTYFGGFKILCTEKEFTRGINEQFELFGKIDVCLLSPEDEIVLVDFKSGYCPTVKDCLWKENSNPENFQIAAYVSLLEEHHKKKVNGAGFYSLKDNAFKSIIGYFDKNKGFDSSRPGGTGKSSCRHHEEPGKSFENTLGALDSALVSYMNFVENPDLAQCAYPKYETCSTCSYKTICRSNFIIGKTLQWGDV